MEHCWWGSSFDADDYAFERSRGSWVIIDRREYDALQKALREVCGEEGEDAKV